MRSPDKYFAREKTLRRLFREARRLWKAQAHAPVVPLEKAYQRGWIKTYVLIEGIDRRPDAPFFRTILGVINKRVYSRDRFFVHRSGRHLELSPRIIGWRKWRELAWPAKYQRFFELGNWRGDYDDLTHFSYERRVHGFKLTHTWWLREDIQPFLITHQRVDLPEVNSRLAEIEAYMQRTCGWQQLDRLRGIRQWRFGKKPLGQQRAAETLHLDLAAHRAGEE